MTIFHAKQVEKLLCATIGVRGLVVNGSSMDVTMQLNAVISAIRDSYGESVPFIASVTETSPGFVIEPMRFPLPKPTAFIPLTAEKKLEYQTNAVNDAPYIDKQIIVTENPVVGTPFTFTIPPGTFVDPEGAALKYWSIESMGQRPAWLAFDQPSGTFSGTPEATSVGITTITVSATDPSYKGVATMFKIDVLPADLPVGQVVSLTSGYEQTPIKNADGARVFGKITVSDSVYTLSFFTGEGSGVPYTFPYPVLVDFHFKYRFSFKDLPPDAYCKTLGLVREGLENLVASGATGAGLFKIEYLTVPTLNTLPTASATPKVGEPFILFVRGQATRKGSDFNVSGTTLTWNAAIAGYSLNVGDTLIYFYAV